MKESYMKENVFVQKDYLKISKINAKNVKNFVLIVYILINVLNVIVSITFLLKKENVNVIKEWFLIKNKRFV